MSPLFVCYYGDGRMWDNTVLAAAYPDGYSYTRPFRYRDRWVQSSLLGGRGAGTPLACYQGKIGVLGMRFMSKEHAHLVLPIRRIEITHVECVPESHCVYFRMGQMLDFRGVADLRSTCLEIPVDERARLRGDELLFFTPVPVTHPVVTTKSVEAAWATYADLIAKDASVPVKEEARQAMFLRLCPSVGSALDKASLLHTSGRIGSIYGASLREGAQYELEVLHRVPHAIGTDSVSPGIDIQYTAPAAGVEMGRVQDVYSGDYQVHVVPFTATVRTSTYHEMGILPQASDATIAAKVSLVPVCTYVKVTMSFWHRVWTRWIWVLAVWVLLSVQALVGQLTDAGDAPSSVWYVGTALSSLATALLLVAKDKAA